MKQWIEKFFSFAIRSAFIILVLTGAIALLAIALLAQSYSALYWNIKRFKRVTRIVIKRKIIKRIRHGK